MPYKDKEKNKEYQRDWARKRGKTKRINQRGPKNRQQLVDDAKSHPCVVCNIESVSYTHLTLPTILLV